VIALAIIFGAGFFLGLIVGRWWTLLAAVAFGAWIWVVSDLEVPSWFAALVYGGATAVTISLGVFVRRLTR
jgi:hypothetical protein